MNAALCLEVGAGAFPSPQQVLDVGPEALQSRCGVGYRAKTICGLAQQVGMPATLSVTHLLHASNHPVPCPGQAAEDGLKRPESRCGVQRDMAEPTMCDLA